jgi:hypothetical protein
MFPLLSMITSFIIRKASVILNRNRRYSKTAALENVLARTGRKQVAKGEQRYAIDP